MKYNAARIDMTTNDEAPVAVAVGAMAEAKDVHSKIIADAKELLGLVREAQELPVWQDAKEWITLQEIRSKSDHPVGDTVDMILFKAFGDIRTKLEEMANPDTSILKRAALGVSLRTVIDTYMEKTKVSVDLMVIARRFAEKAIQAY